MLPLVYRVPLPPSERPHLVGSLTQALRVHVDGLATASTRGEQLAHLEALRALAASAVEGS